MENVHINISRCRGDAQTKKPKKEETKGTLKKKVGELRKKVKSLAQEAANCDNEITKLQVCSCSFFNNTVVMITLVSSLST